MAKLPYVNVDRIKELAKSNGITLKYFCDLFGKKRTYLSDVRSGNNKMDAEELLRIAEVLGTTIEYLTDLTDDPSPKKKEPVEALDPIDAEILQALRDLSVEDLRKVLEYASSLRGE